MPRSHRRCQSASPAWTLTREYFAEDPLYFTDKYVGSDTVLVADVPYEPHPCSELTPEFRPDDKR